MRLGDPADRAVEADQFQPVVNRRAGYGSEDERLERLLAYIGRNPYACGRSGELGLLAKHIHELRAQLQERQR